MSEKTCFKCGNSMPLSAFYRHPRMADGHLNKCKECAKRDVRFNRKERIDYYRKYDRGRGMLPHRVRKREEYRATDQGKHAVAGCAARYRARCPDRRRAHVALNNAVRDGRVVKPSSCSQCGKAGALHGHHEDYSKPLDVKWLCVKCHRQAHSEHEETTLRGKPTATV